MRRSLWFTFATSAILSLLLTTLILLVRVVFAAESGAVAFESDRDGNWEIYLLDLQTDIAHNLTRNPADDFTPTWSPDGTQIVFASLRDGKLGIYVMNADGSDLHAVSRSDNDVTPSWSPDGKQLIYASGVEGSRQLYVVDADGSHLRQLTAFTGDAHAPVWQPPLK